MDDDKPVKKIEVGPPLYMESLLSYYDYGKQSKMYPNTYQSATYRTIDRFEVGEFKCRWRMGMSLTTEEQSNININLQYLLAKVNPIPSPQKTLTN